MKVGQTQTLATHIKMNDYWQGLLEYEKKDTNMKQLLEEIKALQDRLERNEKIIIYKDKFEIRLGGEVEEDKYER